MHVVFPPKQLLYHAIEIQPIRIQESFWILEGIQPNLLIVVCDWFVNKILFKSNLWYFRTS